MEHKTNQMDWIVQCFTFPPHSIGYMGDDFYRSKDPTNSIKSTEGESCKGKQPNKQKENKNYTYAYTQSTII